MQRLCSPIAMLVVSVAMTGCGAQLAEVHGKVMFDGQPAPAGNVTFSPHADGLESGKYATGRPDEKGEFVLSTYTKGDGALVGQHVVYYSPPDRPETQDSVQLDNDVALYMKFGKCRLPSGYNVEIKPGRNDVVLELEIEEDENAQ